MFDSKDLEPISDDENEAEDDLVSEKIVNLLTNVVREQYCAHLEKLLGKNFESWCIKNIGSIENPPNDWIKKCVQLYEIKAIKSCMIAQFYRKSMLKIMDNIRSNTINGKLAEKMKLYSELTNRNLPINYLPHTKNTISQTNCFNLKTIATQTDSSLLFNNTRHCNPFTFGRNDTVNVQLFNKSIQENIIDTSGDHYTNLSLDDKIKLFKNRIFNVKNDNNVPSTSRRKRSPQSPHKRIYKIPTISDNQLNLRENLNVNRIKSPNTLTPEPVTANIIKDDLPKLSPDISNVTKNEEIQPKEDEIAKELDKIFCDEDNDLDDIFGMKDSNINDDPKIDSILKEIEHAQLSNTVKSQESKTEIISQDKNVDINLIKKNENRLYDSIWPCELHMQTQSLRLILSEAGASFGMRFNEKIKLKFVDLFGCDEDDDYGPYSPSLELNDVLLSSCKARIAPWVVKYLMIPMNDGLIANRLIFKNFAKRMASKIVAENQYPYEDDIKDAIIDYFICHKRIDTIDDIDVP